MPITINDCVTCGRPPFVDISAENKLYIGCISGLLEKTCRKDRQVHTWWVYEGIKEWNENNPSQ